MPSEAYKLAEQYRNALADNNIQSIKLIVDAYQGMYRRLSDKIELLTYEIGNLEHPTRAELMRLRRLTDLIAQVEEELSRYGVLEQANLSVYARQALERGLRESRALAEAQFAEYGIQASMRGLTPQAVESLLGFLDPGGKLYQRIGKLAGETAARMRDNIIEGVMLGKNPRAIAAQIVKDLGLSLTSAMRTTQTVQMYAYREASRANYYANRDIVEGWYWMSSLDPRRSCIACISMHGTFHTLEETLDDHYNGLCYMIPGVKGTPNQIEVNGKEWFDALAPNKQAEIMGRGVHKLYTSGQVGWDQLAVHREEEVYGSMIGSTPLRDLLP